MAANALEDWRTIEEKIDDDEGEEDEESASIAVGHQQLIKTRINSRRMDEGDRTSSNDGNDKEEEDDDKGTMSKEVLKSVVKLLWYLLSKI